VRTTFLARSVDFALTGFARIGSVGIGMVRVCESYAAGQRCALVGID
jgi:hypothetical protein